MASLTRKQSPPSTKQMSSTWLGNSSNGEVFAATFARSTWVNKPATVVTTESHRGHREHREKRNKRGKKRLRISWTERTQPPACIFLLSASSTKSAVTSSFLSS